MTSQPPTLIKSTLCALLFSLMMNSLAAWAKTGDETQPIDVSADSSEYDDKARVQRLIGNVEISQGTMKILASEIAIYLDANSQLTRIAGDGNPIRFEQLNDSDERIVGEANNIDYNAVDGTLILSGNATLSQPRQNLTSGKIVFNSRARTIKADGGNSGRVSIRLQPPKSGQ